jgi:four helix bundle protein
LSQPEELRARTKVLGKQVLRSGTAVGANYRAVCRARSRAEFIAKIGVVVEEADETVFWLELLAETGIVKESRLKNLLTEAKELTAIFAASQRTAKCRPRRSATQSGVGLTTQSEKGAMTQSLNGSI